MSLDEFEIWPDPTTDYRASFPEASEKLMFPFFLAFYNGSQVSIVALWATCCICENKDADQPLGNREADQRLCFRYIDSTIPLLPKYENSSL